MEKPPQIKLPHTFVFLFILVLLSCLMTYIIPAGSFERVFDEKAGQTLLVPGSYSYMEQSPVAPWLIFHKFYEALCLPKTASLMWLILITGGSFEIIMGTGCLTKLCARSLRIFHGGELWIIPIFISLFSVFGFTMGLTTASVIFVPLGIAAAHALGIDRMSGLAMITLGVNAGFTAGVFNPFSVGVAQTIAELPLFSGAWLRWLTLPVLIVVTSAYIMSYAKKNRLSMGYEKTLSEMDQSPINHSEKFSLILFSTGFLILTMGISLWGWKTADIVVAFLVIGVTVGLAAGYKISNICDCFIAGSRKMMKGVIVIGIASTIRLILTDGGIMDTITYYLTQRVYQLPPVFQLLGMFLFNALINFLITSGSAKAALIMPIMTPMADSLGLSRQAAVYAFQLGDGLTNVASPISTTLNGVLAVSEVTYEKWIRFYAPLVGIYLMVGAVLVIFSQLIGY
ncbi:AbgT family transporter [Petroclostridium sp. X23]|uniref:YfcC family protein n=1 Tax=Petroclostridium sp. X23 TaxID=3045146 RepID=UPI0024AD12A1|nr:AbgT family transporter [Petroclostridium sp. X23]WHH61332.1 AbgT family transporter [Petroclostridium sp. X23]